jgi:hypothetical protein
MQYLISPVLLALVLGTAACTPQQQQSSLPSIEVALAVAETAANGYKNLPPCGVAPCCDPAIVAKMKAADNVAYDAVKAAQKSAAAGSSVDVTAAMAALGAFQALIVAYVPKGT